MPNLAPYHAFLATPNNDTLNEFFKSPAVLVVDWDEDNTDILDYLNEHLPEGEKIDYEEASDDIVLIKNGVRETIPYQDEGRALLAAQKYLGEAWQIYWFTGTLRCDTLGFCLLHRDDWAQLAAQYGEDVLAVWFEPIATWQGGMFDLGFNEAIAKLNAQEAQMANPRYWQGEIPSDGD